MTTRLLRRKVADFVAFGLSLVLPKRVLSDRRYFYLWEKRGFHITPIHFYYPIPDTRELGNELWAKSSNMVGINVNEEKQLELLELFMSKFKNEYDSFPMQKTPVPYRYYVNNDPFESVDGEILYCMIRHFKPERIIEIGSGYSTYLSAEAVLRNKKENPNYDCKLTAVDPYPNAVLKKGFPGLSELVSKGVQDLPLTDFMKLGENDILFIDSTHISQIGSDVNYEYLEILPRLKKGVMVHAHDIFLPAEYPKEWIQKMAWFWNEQYLLQAFLSFNESFEVLWAGSYMHLKNPDKLEKAFRSYKLMIEKWVGPGSFWIRRVR
jgi:hypothetical protein